MKTNSCIDQYGLSKTSYHTKCLIEKNITGVLESFITGPWQRDRCYIYQVRIKPSSKNPAVLSKSSEVDHFW